MNNGMYAHAKTMSGVFLDETIRTPEEPSKPDDLLGIKLHKAEMNIEEMSKRLVKMDKMMKQMYEAIKVLDRQNAELRIELDGKVDHQNRYY